MHQQDCAQDPSNRHMSCFHNRLEFMHSVYIGCTVSVHDAQAFAQLMHTLTAHVCIIYVLKMRHCASGVHVCALKCVWYVL